MTITLKKYNNALYIMFLIECIIPFRHKIELIYQLFLELIENISFFTKYPCKSCLFDYR